MKQSTNECYNHARIHISTVGISGGGMCKCMCMCMPTFILLVGSNGIVDNVEQFVSVVIPRVVLQVRCR